ncbi:hypothetical protein IE53DRAFT_371641 [Violaceomyces palustris]|uniref:Uncharacterized protein n=1 Tax=Violaceomyces palustris TaxID=1673888 RepID=A0ACD0NN13_9BASI|nr:hypothetical protein IE53DRAFT_371641 [Violaceomyces palustris]
MSAYASSSAGPHQLSTPFRSSQPIARKQQPSKPNVSCSDSWASWMNAYRSGEWPTPLPASSSSHLHDDYSSSLQPDAGPSNIIHPAHRPNTPSDTLLTPPPQNGDLQDASAPLAGPSKPTHRKSNSKDRVLDDDGSWLDSLAFYKKYGYVAAPRVPKCLRMKRARALRRHRLTVAQEREALHLYIQHAKAVFKADYASFMIASVTDDENMLVLAQEGGRSEVKVLKRSVTLCGHAMLLKRDEVLVVRDASQDWRFRSCPSVNQGGPCSEAGSALNFYASAPLYLSAPTDSGDELVPVGRLCIMSERPRPEFDEADAKLLLSIAKMAGDSLEREHQSRLNANCAEMQRRTAFLCRSLENRAFLEPPASFSEESRSSSLSETPEGMLKYSMKVVTMSCEEIKRCTGASAVAVVDVSGFRVKKSNNVKGTQSPRNSAFPLTPWQGQVTSTFTAPLTPPAEPSEILSPESLSSPNGSPRTSRFSLTHSRSSLGSEEFEIPDECPGAQMLALEGDERHGLSLRGPIQCRALCNYVTKISKDCGGLVRAKTYQTSSESSDEEDDQQVQAALDLNLNPLGSLLPDEVQVSQYMAACAFEPADKTKPLFLIVAMFQELTPLEESHHLFFESCTQVALASILRQRMLDVDSAQAQFLRHVQHNLRTPLHGAMGAVDFLRGAISGEDQDEDLVKIDLSSNGVLAGILDSIALSGSTLNSYIDDLLSFQNISGLGHSRSTRSRESVVDLVKLVEEICSEEWEFAQRLDLQGERLDELYISKTRCAVELIVRASPCVVKHKWRIDESAVKKLVRKVVSNAIRFTNEGYVEVSIEAHSHEESGEGQPVFVSLDVQDTGIGMTKDFVRDQLTKPFTKGDSFRDGIGLGMTIVSSTLQKMGGCMTVDSALNQGTKIKMSVPSSPVFVGTPPAAAEPPSFAVKTIQFLGIDTRGLKRMRNSIFEHLASKGGLTLSVDHRDADAVFISEHWLAHCETENREVFEQLKPNARFIILASVPLVKKPRKLEALEDRPVLPFPLPHGPSSLALVERFLMEENPLVIRNPMRNKRVAPKVVPGGHGRNGSVAGQGPPSSSSAAAAAAAAAPPRPPLATEEQASSTSSPLSPPLPSAPLRTETATDQVIQADPPNQTKPTLHIDPTLKERDFRVLVVEDNPINMKLLTTIVKRLDLPFETAQDGAEAVQKFLSFKPALVLLDISLPIQDGFEAASQMRSHRHPCHIVAITALSSDEDRARGIETCGMDDWLTKPVSTRKLRDDLKEWKRIWDQHRIQSSSNGIHRDQSPISIALAKLGQEQPFHLDA